jgi:hypothetical protein
VIDPSALRAASNGFAFAATKTDGSITDKGYF